MNVEPETHHEETLRALAACGEVLTAIASVAADDVFGKESPFNQRVLSGLALATWKLADFAYWESREPGGNRRTLEFSVDAKTAAQLDQLAECSGCSRDEAATQAVVEGLRQHLKVSPLK